MLISLHISNRFAIECKIQIVIQMLYHSFETLLLLRVCLYLIVKSAKLFVKIGSRLQMPLFFLYHRNFQQPSSPAYFDPSLIWFYLMFQSPSPCLQGLPVCSGPKRMWLTCFCFNICSKILLSFFSHDLLNLWQIIIQQNCIHLVLKVNNESS